MRPCWGGGGQGEGFLSLILVNPKKEISLIPKCCKNVTTESGNTQGEVLGEKLAPFPALFVGKKKNICHKFL